MSPRQVPHAATWPPDPASPDGPHKAFRQSQQQTTPRRASDALVDSVPSSLPRVRAAPPQIDLECGGAAPAHRDSLDSGSTGLTPMAAHLSLASERSTARDAWLTADRPLRASPACVPPYLPGIPIIACASHPLPVETKEGLVYEMKAQAAAAATWGSVQSLSGGNASVPQAAVAAPWSYRPAVPATLEAPPAVASLTPATVLTRWPHLLTEYERVEVLQYPRIWYLGRLGTKKIDACPRPCHPPYSESWPGTEATDIDSPSGFDDARGEYLAIVGDHIAYRYEVLGVLGRGSFGQVLRCADHAVGGTHVALKVIRNKRRFERQARVEAAILATLRDGGGARACIVRMHDVFPFRSHLCITFELLGANLYEHIKAGDFRGCAAPVVRAVACQVLRALCFCHAQGILHCDLKPENILVTNAATAAVKVVDFGSSCYANNRVFTYIQSRFYRAPEVILGLPYSSPIDLWSLACILAELHTGQPLFPGEDEGEQLACVMEMLGAPPPRLLVGATRARMFFDPVTWRPRPQVPNSRGKIRKPGTLTLEKAIGRCRDPVFLDFLRCCLQWDPAQRPTAEQAAAHEWLAGAGGGKAAPPVPRPASTAGAGARYYSSSSSANTVISHSGGCSQLWG
jgi:serine/threonine protein kinase